MTITHHHGDLDRLTRDDLEALDALDAITWSASSAACLDVDPELFFSEVPADLELAKQVCAKCPVRQRCLDGAVARGEPHGVWGGQIFDNGVVIERKRPRGRPRKQPLPPQADHGARQADSRAA